MAWTFIANIKGNKGDKGDTIIGPPGLNGTNVVPSDTAVAGYAGTDGTSLTKTALITRAGVFNAKTDTNGGIAAALAMSDHTLFLQAAFTAAAALGFRQIIIPQLDPSDPSRPWVLNGQLTAYAGLTVHAEDAEFKQTAVGRPVFYVGPTADYVSIHVKRAYYDNGLGRRILYADIPTTGTVNGKSPRGNCVGILSDASYGNFTGHFSGFPFGVILTRPDADPVKRVGNVVDITVDDVDFGLAYDTQHAGDFKVAGSYTQMTDSADPSHLIYAVINGGIPTTGCTVDGNAWDSYGGVPFSFKAQKGAIIKSLIARNTPGILNVVDPLGPIVFDVIHGTDIRTETFGVNTSAIETGFSGLVPSAAGTKVIGTARIAFADGVSTVTGFRAANFDDDWTVGLLEVEYNTDAVNNAQTMVQLNGNRSHIGLLKIRNKGTGGIRGVRYVTGTSGHYLANSPSIIGGADGVVVDAGVLNSNLCVDEQSINPAAGYLKLVAKPDLSVTIRTGSAFARRLRPNRWFAAPEGVGSPVALIQNEMGVVPVTLQRAAKVDKLSVNVTTAAASNSMRLGIYADNGEGYPGALVVDGGTASAATTGAKTVTFATVTLPPGTYWLAYVLQGGTGAAVSGLPLTAVDYPSVSEVNALTGRMPIPTAVTGALPAAWAYASDGAHAGIAKIAYSVPA